MNSQIKIYLLLAWKGLSHSELADYIYATKQGQKRREELSKEDYLGISSALLPDLCISCKTIRPDTPGGRVRKICLECIDSPSRDCFDALTAISLSLGYPEETIDLLLTKAMTDEPAT